MTGPSLVTITFYFRDLRGLLSFAESIPELDSKVSQLSGFESWPSEEIIERRYSEQGLAKFSFRLDRYRLGEFDLRNLLFKIEAFRPNHYFAVELHTDLEAESTRVGFGIEAEELTVVERLFAGATLLADRYSVAAITAWGVKKGDPVSRTLLFTENGISTKG